MEDVWFFGVLFGFGIFFLVIALVLYILAAIGMMKLAEKSNVPNAWLAFVPIASTWVLGEIISDRVPPTFQNQTGFWLLGISVASFLLDLIPFMTFITTPLMILIGIYVMYQLFAKFTENAVLFTVLSVVSFGFLYSIFVFVIRNNEIIDGPPKTISSQ